MQRMEEDLHRSVMHNADNQIREDALTLVALILRCLRVIRVVGAVRIPVLLRSLEKKTIATTYVMRVTTM